MRTSLDALPDLFTSPRLDRYECVKCGRFHHLTVQSDCHGVRDRAMWGLGWGEKVQTWWCDTCLAKQPALRAEIEARRSVMTRIVIDGFRTVPR